MEAVAVVVLAQGQSDPTGDLSAYQLAADLLFDFRDPRAVDTLYTLHTVAIKISRAGENIQLRTAMLTLATKALAMAVEVCELCYGKQHGHSISLRGLESILKRSRLSS